MSEKKSLVSFAASVAATIKCCAGNVETNTNTSISGNSENTIEGNPSQAVAPLVKSASSTSTDITPIVEERERENLPPSVPP